MSPERLIEVRNIPASFHVCDLRAFFSSWIEQGKFEMFHYKHRKEIVNPSSYSSCSCLVKLVSESDSLEFARRFHQKKWTNSQGEYEGTECIVEIAEPSSDNTLASHSSALLSVRANAYATKKELKILASNRMRESELFAPSGLPQGFVGTPSHVIRRHAHELPAGLLQRLGVDKLPPNSEFQYVYQSSNRTRVDDHGDKSSSTLSSKRKVCKATNTTPKAKIKKSNDSSWIEWTEAEEPNEESDAEEWDRHMFYHPVLDEDRLLGLQGEEKAFEWKIPNPWDKQEASGLVWYTDTLYWDKQKGDFDERTVDELDVDVREQRVRKEGQHLWLQEKNSVSSPIHHFHFRNGLVPSRNSRKAALIAASRSRLLNQLGTASDEEQENVISVKTKSPKAWNTVSNNSDEWRPELAVKLMERMGWRNGTGLGKRGQGLVIPISATPRVERKGLGFTKTVLSAADVEILPLGHDELTSSSARHFARLRN